MLQFTLTNDQTVAWQKLQNFVASSDLKSRFFSLKGSAGSGKSFLMKKLLELSNKNTFFYFTAPTNKAAAVLSKFVEVPTTTIYSLLNLKLDQDEDQSIIKHARDDKRFFTIGELSYSNGSRGKIFIVVDESSMINKQLVKFIEELVARTHNVYFIFVGDTYQLPPVGEKESKCWELVKNEDYKAILTEIVRYSNTILTLATDIRTAIDNQNWGYKISSAHDGVSSGVWRLTNSSKFVKSMVKSVAKDPRNVKAAAWKNRTVNAYNTAIREELGFISSPYVVGEVVAAGGPIYVNGNQQTPVANTEDELLILKVEASNKSMMTANKQWYDISTIKLTVCLLVHEDDDNKVTFDVHLCDDETTFGDLQSNLVRKAKNSVNKSDSTSFWNIYWSNKASMSMVKHAYANTCHRLQGSTVRSIWVDDTCIRSNRIHDEAMSCLYTAVTRATDSVICLTT